jgi:hypothetical protein
MVARPTLTTKAALYRIAKALKDFAEKEEGLRRGQYRILFKLVEDWGHINVMLILDDFKGRSDREIWDKVYDYLHDALKKEGDTGFVVGHLVRERSQVERGGIYGIPETYVDVADLLPASMLEVEPTA